MSRSEDPLRHFTEELTRPVEALPAIAGLAAQAARRLALLLRGQDPGRPCPEAWS